jgi:hypothetical protein
MQRDLTDQAAIVGRDRALRFVLFAAAIVGPLAFSLGPASAREHRSQAVAREFEREHPCPLDRANQRPLPRLLERPH